MANQLWQVFRTYTTSWFFWGIVGFWLLQNGALVLGARPWPSEPAPMWLRSMGFGPTLANLGVGMLVGILLKLQFANPRARLLPHFAAAHLVIAAGILTAAVVGHAWAFSRAAGVPGLAVASFGLLVIGTGLWGSYVNLAGLAVPLFILMMLTIQLAAPNIVALIMDGGTVASLSILGVEVAALAALGVRLWTLQEGMPEYSRTMWVSPWDFTSSAGRRTRRQVEAQAITRSGLQRWVRDLEFNLLSYRQTGLGLLRRLLLHQLAGGFPGLSWAPLQLGMILFLFLLPWLKGACLGPLGPGGAMSPFLLLAFPFFFAMSRLGGCWLRRSRHLARELLYPLSRTDFVGDLARSIGCDMIAVAVAQCAGIVLGRALFCPQCPLGTFLLPYLAITAAEYALGFGVMLWLVSFRRLWVILLGVMVLWVAGTAMIMWAGLPAGWRESSMGLAGAVAVAVVAAVGLYRLAFRRWCRVDLG